MQHSNLLQIVHDRSFRRLCVPVRCAFHSAHWRQQHPAVPFWTLENRLTKITNIYLYQHDQETQHVYLETLNKLLTAIGSADQRLQSSTEDMADYVRLLNEHGSVVASLYLAYTSATSDYVTPAQVAAFTGDAESTWRNRAARHDIPLAWKAGKQWLLPKDVLLFLYNIEMPDEVSEPDPDASEADEEPQMSDEEYHRVMRQLNQNLN